MQKITKGALAAGAAALLLIGGGSTLAKWTDDAAIQGGDIEFGTFALEAGENPSVGVTGLVAGGESEPIVSTYAVALDGTDLTAELTVSAPTIPEGSDSDLSVTTTATFTPKDSVESEEITIGTPLPVTGSGTVTVTSTVALAQIDEDLKGGETVTVQPGNVDLTQTTAADVA